MEICGGYNPPTLVRLDKFWDNNIESWQCGPHLHAMFCADVVMGKYGCLPSRFNSGAGSNSSNPHMNTKNLISNIIVKLRDDPFPFLKETTVYTNTDCSGHSLFLHFIVKKSMPLSMWNTQGRSYQSLVLPEGRRIVLYYNAEDPEDDGSIKLT